VGKLPLGLPLSDLHLARIERLERLVGRGRYLGWCGLPDGDAFAVDVARPGADETTPPRRSTGATLHLALGAALAAAAQEGRAP
jgi:hypothetical protein